MKMNGLKINQLNTNYRFEIINLKEYFSRFPDKFCETFHFIDLENVDWDYSFGLMCNEDVAGCILHSILYKNEKKHIFNHGTVLDPCYADINVVEEIYKELIPMLKKEGFSDITLEVLHKNIDANITYENIGFEKTKELKCFQGALDNINISSDVYITLEEKLPSISELVHQDSYSGNNSYEKCLTNDFASFYYVFKEADHFPIGYFIYDSELERILQFETFGCSNRNWYHLFQGIKKITNEIEVLNVCAGRLNKIHFLKRIGMTNFINQHLMTFNLN
jgi:predicted CopG family antitoxin